MKPYKVLIFIMLSFALLGALGAVFPEDGLKIEQWTLYFPNPTEIFKSEKNIQIDIEKKLEQLHLEAAMTAELQLLTDSFMFYKDYVSNNTARLHFPENNYAFFDTLFRQLEQSSLLSQTVHIVHYGDSQIEMDRITSTFRQRLQEQFGGEGAGIVPAIQIVPSVSVSQSYSGDLTRYICYGDSTVKKASHKRYGIMASFAQLNGNATISLRGSNHTRAYEGTKKFSRINLLLGHNSANFSASCNNQKKIIKDSIAGVSLLTWDFDEPISRATINLQGNAEIYGISLEGNAGVTVDNVPLRGCSGTIFTLVDGKTLKQCYEYANVKLIIMQFGGNIMPVVNSSNTIKYYTGLISKQIQYLQKNNPSAKIMFIGPSDMSKTVNGKLQTYPYLPAVNDSLRSTVLRNGAAYWDMFQVMGGENSMLDWVKHSPAWAGSDHIHFTSTGAEKIATALADAFFVHYQFYMLRKRYNPDISENELYYP